MPAMNQPWSRARLSASRVAREENAGDEQDHDVELARLEAVLGLGEGVAHCGRAPLGGRRRCGACCRVAGRGACCLVGGLRRHGVSQKCVGCSRHGSEPCGRGPTRRSRSETETTRIRYVSAPRPARRWPLQVSAATHPTGVKGTNTRMVALIAVARVAVELAAYARCSPRPWLHPIEGERGLLTDVKS